MAQTKTVVTDAKKQKQVKDWVAKHPEPDSRYVTGYTQMWETVDGRIYWNSVTGKRTHEDPTPEYRAVSVRQTYQSVLIKDCGHGMIEISGVTCSGNRGVDGCPAIWKYPYCNDIWEGVGRFFFFRGEPVVYDAKGNVFSKPGKYYTEEAMTFLAHLQMPTYTLSQRCREEFTKWSEQPKVWRYNSYEDIQYLCHVCCYMQAYNVPHLMTGKIVNEVIDLHLPDVHVNHAENGCKIRNYAVFQQAGEYGVLRLFGYNTYKPDYIGNGLYNYHRDDDTSNEYARVFINDNGDVRVLNRRGDHWNLTTTMPHHNWHDDVKLMNKADMVTCKRLKYIMPCLDEDYMDIIPLIITMIRHPFIESLAKAGYPKLAKQLVNTSTGGIGEQLNLLFAVKEQKKYGSLYEYLGVSKSVLQRYEASIADETLRSNELPFYLKVFFGTKDISHIDDKTVNEVFDGLQTLSSYDCRWWRIVSPHYWTRNRNEMITDCNCINDDGRKILMHLFRQQQKNADTMQLFCDTLSIYDSLEQKPIERDVLLNFEDYNQLLRWHDAFNDMYREQRTRYAIARNQREAEENKRLMTKFNETNKARIEKFNYIGDTFQIRTPECLNEISTEGAVLSHCVAGYRNSVAEGRTNILFLRRNDKPLVPFYTMEIDNNNHVIQIHGYKNKWLGNNPEAISFVYAYLKHIGAKFDKDILLDKSQGYCAMGKYVDERYLTSPTLD